MREIKFRGLQLGDIKNEWHYGYFVNVNDLCYIFKEDKPVNNIIKSTIGQYTGLKDKKGVEIYEGDILRWTEMNRVNNNGEVAFIKHSEVSFDEASFYVKFAETYTEELSLYHDMVEVVGNIHQSPELLK